MGLDVYLYSAAEEADSRAWDRYYEAEEDDSLTEAELEALKPEGSCLPSDVPSAQHPEHLFNRRYLRSSYNDGGFNSAVPQFLGDQDATLYGIFEPVFGSKNPDYSFELTAASASALREAAERALSVAQRLRECEPLRTEIAAPMLGSAEHMWRDLPSAAEVLEWYRAERVREIGRDPRWGEGYNCAKGSVFGLSKGVHLEVVAATVGKSVFGPCAVLVYKPSREAVDSYVASAEITAEFCEEAIALIEADGAAFIHWSG